MIEPLETPILEQAQEPIIPEGDSDKPKPPEISTQEEEEMPEPQPEQEQSTIITDELKEDEQEE